MRKSKLSCWGAAVLCLLIHSCGINKPAESKEAVTPASAIEPAKYTFHDSLRNREIPLAIYLPEGEFPGKGKPLVVFSHGYGENNSDSYLSYSFLGEYLAANGFPFVSIQHELPTDELLPFAGVPQVVRMPNWERGSANIGFVVAALKHDFPDWDFSRLVVMGHSNGGDMSVLFARQNPALVWKLITLDNRRMAFPRNQTPQIYSLRSSDQPADEGVLPLPTEQENLGMKIVKLKNTTHNEMSDSADETQKEEMKKLILNFVQEENP
ncbi:MAG: alpha/beta hydrolase [Bacteroidia bacterium]